MQLKYNLGKIEVISDKEGSYHAVCFTIVDYPTLLKILANSDGVDVGFLQWTARLGQAAIRLSPKKDRGKMRLVHTLEGRSEPIPEKLKAVQYDIPLSRGVTIGH